MTISNFTNNYVIQVLFLTIAIIVIGCTIVAICYTMKKEREIQRKQIEIDKKKIEAINKYLDIEDTKQAYKIYNDLKDFYK